MRSAERVPGVEQSAVAVRPSPSSEASRLGEVETTPRPPKSYQVA